MYSGITVQTFVKGEPKGSKTITKMQIEIGEDDDSDIWLEDSDVEYHQANILLLPEGAFVEDHYTEGTFLNGKQVKKPMPIKEGDQIACGNSKVVIEKLLEEGAKIEIPPRFCSIKLLDKCPHCGGGLPVNGVIKTIPCSSCQQGVTFKDQYWKVMLEDLDDDYDQGGGNYTINMETSVKWRAEKPKCVKCEAELPVDDIPIGTDHDIPCKSCGERNTTYAAPDFARGVLPSLSQIYCAERGVDGDGAAAVQADDGVKPIVLTCPNCRGSLTAGSKSERTFNCQYCGSDVFLPDDLWSKLHPAKTAAKWYLRFDGKRPKDYEEEKEAPRKLEEIRERMKTQKKSRGFNPLSLLPFAGILIPVVIVIYSLASGDGPGWTSEYLAPTSAQVGQVNFAINVPPSFAARNEAGAMVWSPPGISPSYVNVSPAAVAPRTAQEAMAQVQGQYKPNMQILGAQPIQGGFMVTLKDVNHQSAEVQVYRQRSVAAPAQPGYPQQAVAAGGPTLWCVAHFERPQAEGPLGDMDELLAYLSNICGSLNVY